MMIISRTISLLSAPQFAIATAAVETVKMRSASFSAPFVPVRSFPSSFSAAAAEKVMALLEKRAEYF
jgi:hypothetical protein